ncbi:hypothetical protein GE061_012571 [Apolygus lucorum]|uniref:Uncharacterized protein n=1 Tax=Apolygus lucorum TaxID=248454 RepID=A0A8S9XSY3_APOLU|nr:hypothetical protein GE061_012571 [Apolygus lucorum]
MVLDSPFVESNKRSFMSGKPMARSIADYSKVTMASSKASIQYDPLIKIPSVEYEIHDTTALRTAYIYCP